MSRHQADSDPLPYVQVDRSVRPRAALLASAIGCTTQHALGSLVEWWDLCADPRELERVVLATAAGERPAVVLDGAVVALRWRLASGHDVQPSTLATLGLLEPLGEDRYRVRGMSRQLGVVAARVRARRVASAGGKASAAARQQALGTAQPRREASAPVGSSPFDSSAPTLEPARTEIEPTLEPTLEPARTDARTPPNPRGQRSSILALTYGKSVREQLEIEPARTDVEPTPEPKRQPDPRHAPLVAALVAAGATVTRRHVRAVSELLELATQATDREHAADEVLARWRRALAHQGYPTVREVGELVKNWGHFAPPRDTIADTWAGTESGDIAL